MDSPQVSLGTCLDRVQKAEQQLFLALNEIVDTRKYIVQLVEQAGNRYNPKAGAVASEECIVSVDSLIELGNSLDVDKSLDVDEYLLQMSPRSAKVQEERAGQEGLPAVVPAKHNEEVTAKQHEEVTDEDAPVALSSARFSIQEIAQKTASQLGLSADDVAQAYTLFCQHDTDKSGLLSVSELHVLLQKLVGSDITKNQTDRILRQVDKDFDSKLDFEEFLLFICNTHEKKREYLEAAVYQDKKLNRGFLVKMKGISYTTVVGFLQKEVAEMTAFLSIPVIIFMFFCFILSAQLHRESSVLRSFENSFKTDIEDNANFAYLGVTPFENGREGFKNIYDVHTLEDFWSWMDLGLMPLFFPAGWGGSEARSNVGAYCSSPFDSMKGNGWNIADFKGNVSDYASRRAYFLDSNLCDLEMLPPVFPNSLKSLNQFANSTKKPYRLFNEIVAGVRMEQEQLPHVDCRKPEFFGHVYVTPCIEENYWAWLSPEMDTALDMNEELVNKPGGETVYLKSGTPLNEVKGVLRQLEDERWLNQKTSKVQILLTTYNNHMDMFAAIYVNVFINRAGQMHKVVKPVCIWLHPYRNAFAYVSDVVLVLLVMRLFVSEVREVFRELNEFGVWRGLGSYFQSFKNVVDWASIVYSIVIFTIWLVWCQKVSAFGDLLKSANADIAGSWSSTGDAFSSSNAEYWEEVDSLVNYQRLYLTYVVAYYPFVIGARFFAICNSQPRLGLVTATLGMAAKDIFHFLVVLFATLVIFCSSGELLFGLEVDEYENFGRTFISVVRAMLGDFDYIALTKVGRFPAVIWWLSFVVLVNLIMLNMLLVIIMDVYGHIKSGLDSADEDNFPTIWSQTYEILERWKNEWQGIDVPIPKILRTLQSQKEGFECKSSSPKLITVDVLVGHVENMSVNQAETILTQAYEWHSAVRSQENSHSMSDIMAKLRVVDLRIQQSQEVLDDLERKEPNKTQPIQSMLEQRSPNKIEPTWM